MQNRALLIAVFVVSSIVVAVGCGSDGKSKAASEDKGSGLMLSNDTPLCRKALECCEKMVELDKGKASPEDINLSCSGVGMAADDKGCDDFKKGYAMSIEGKGKPVPDSCK